MICGPECDKKKQMVLLFCPLLFQKALMIMLLFVYRMTMHKDGHFFGPGERISKVNDHLNLGRRPLTPESFLDSAVWVYDAFRCLWSHIDSAPVTPDDSTRLNHLENSKKLDAKILFVCAVRMCVDLVCHDSCMFLKKNLNEFRGMVENTQLYVYFLDLSLIPYCIATFIFIVKYA